MPARKTTGAKKSARVKRAGGAAKKVKPAKKAAARAVPRAIKKGGKGGSVARGAGSKKAPAKKAPAKIQALDLSAFPPESVVALEKRLCLACVLDVFTRHLGMAARTAHLEVKRYTPGLAELYAPTVARPWFEGDLDCPYCGSAGKWHARLWVYRIESGKAADGVRRGFVKGLPQSSGQFAILEEKATGQQALFEWLDKISEGLDLDDPTWLREVSRHYLGRKEPKTDWSAQFAGIHGIRRSRRLESGWEVDGGRLFLAPLWFDELLLVQYLVSRSHKAGGLTLEGRYTLPELFVRLRNAGYLRATGIGSQNAGDALEQLVAYLGGGDTAIKFYYIVDRRDFLDKVQALRLVRPPRPKRQIG